jgi:hypothetical protein
MDAELHAVLHSAVKAAIGPLRKALRAFLVRGRVEMQATMSRSARRAEMCALRALNQDTALKVSPPRTAADAMLGLSVSIVVVVDAVN